MFESREAMKRNAAIEAIRMIKGGMVVGLGTGSTVRYVLQGLSDRIREEELEILGIPTSKDTEDLARRLAIPLTTLNEHPTIDLDIDGADEVDPRLNLIKGGGGAHVREKIVAKASNLFVVVVDETKISKKLGQKSPVPVEVIPMAAAPVSKEIARLGGSPIIRKVSSGDKLFITDNCNLVLDCSFGPINDPGKLEAKLKSITGVVDSGIFSGLADLVIVGMESGSRTMQLED